MRVTDRYVEIKLPVSLQQVLPAIAISPHHPLSLRGLADRMVEILNIIAPQH